MLSDYMVRAYMEKNHMEKNRLKRNMERDNGKTVKTEQARQDRQCGNSQFNTYYKQSHEDSHNPHRHNLSKDSLSLLIHYGPEWKKNACSGAREQSESCGARKRASGAREWANGWASEPVLQSVFLVILAHSALGLFCVGTILPKNDRHYYRVDTLTIFTITTTTAQFVEMGPYVRRIT